MEPSLCDLPTELGSRSTDRRLTVRRLLRCFGEDLLDTVRVAALPCDVVGDVVLECPEPGSVDTSLC